MLEQQSKQRKKTGPKPLYGEAKKMVSFRLSPEALAIIKRLADENHVSQAEIIEKWSRVNRNQDVIATASPNASVISENRELVGAERAAA